LASEAPVCSKTYWWFLMGRKVVSGFEEEGKGAGMDEVCGSLLEGMD